MWMEAKEEKKTLIDKYGELLCFGNLSKLSKRHEVAPNATTSIDADDHLPSFFLCNVLVQSG